MKNIAKIASIMLAAVLLVVLSCGCAPKKVIETGTCGDDAEWVLDDGTLTITGTGAIDEPIEAKGLITKIVVNDGIDSLGTGAFKNLSTVEEITLPDTLEYIGAFAFDGCTGIEEIEIPDSVKDIARSAFENWEETQKIIAQWYEGAADKWYAWFELWKEYFEKLKDYFADEEFQGKVQSFFNEWGTYALDNIDEIREPVEKFAEGSQDDFQEILSGLSELSSDFIADVFSMLPDIQEAIDGAKEDAGDVVTSEDWLEFWNGINEEVKAEIEKFYEE
ncbi:MAG: leucine-rich repeat domain-containing protein [Clostridia bacterium]|nr:leucine-rich repeat domain-containing protein [Clostridia bacterium]